MRLDRYPIQETKNQTCDYRDPAIFFLISTNVNLIVVIFMMIFLPKTYAVLIPIGSTIFCSSKLFLGKKNEISESESGS